MLGGEGRRVPFNDRGERVGVILDIEEYERLLDALEDAEDLRAADGALEEIQHGEDRPVPWEQVRGNIGSEYEPPKDA